MRDQQEEKRRDDDCSVRHEADFVDASADTEVDVHLPPEVADAGVDTVDVSDLADAGMALPADLAAMVTVGVASLADAGMAFPADLAGLATVGVTDLADVVSIPESGGDVVVWGDRTSSGVWCRMGTPSRSDVDFSMWAVWAVFWVAWIVHRRLRVAPAPW